MSHTGAVSRTRIRTANSAPESTAKTADAPPRRRINELHATGNQEMQRLFAERTIRAKLDVSRQSDPREYEADRIARQVVSNEVPACTCAPGTHDTCPACLGRSEATILPKVRPEARRHPELRSIGLDGGRPLGAGERGFFEPRLGVDLGGVRIHTGGAAERSTAGIDARAFTLGSDIAFARGEYNPESTEGRLLLAHELAHVVQQGKGTATSSTMRVAGNLAVQRLQRSDSSPTLIQRQPNNPNAPVRTEESKETAVWDWLMQGVSGGATGGGRLPGFMISPPVRGPWDPFLPLSTRLKSGLGPLGPLPEGMYGFERYVGPNILKELKPRITMEGNYLQQFEAWQRLSGGAAGTFDMSSGQIEAAKWPKLFGLGSSELESIPALVRRMNTEGWGALKPFEQELVKSFFRAHGEAGMTVGSPAISGTTRPGLSEMPHFGALRERPYVVRVKVPASEVGEVNTILGTARPQHLVEEMEVLVFTDAGGKITNIRPNPVHGLGRAAPSLRGAGGVGLGVGLGYSAYRIANAPPEERGRVIIEEVGGHAGGFAGGAFAAKVCAPLLGGGPIGIAGFIVCGLTGAFLGSIAGSTLGSLVAAGTDIMAMSMTGDIFPYLLALGSQDPTACLDDPMAPECPEREVYLRKLREAELTGGLPPASEWNSEAVPGPTGPTREPSLPELVTGSHWLSERDRMLFIVRYLRSAQNDPARRKQFEIGMAIYWEDLWNAGYLDEGRLKSRKEG